MSDTERQYGIDELAEHAGVSRRTVRYYVQRGLLPAPTGLGRGKHYTEGHLRTLIAIRTMQEADVSLDDIRARLLGERPSEPILRETTSISVWTRISVADGVELHLRDRQLGDAQRSAVIRAIQAAIEEGSS